MALQFAAEDVARVAGFLRGGRLANPRSLRSILAGVVKTAVDVGLAIGILIRLAGRE